MEESDTESYEPLLGGVANAGGEFRVGDEVRRPHQANIEAIGQLASHLRAHHVEAPLFLGRDNAGRDRMLFIEGEVATPPFPAWAMSLQSLRSTARLLRRFHEATATFPQPVDARWDRSMATPAGGPVIGHNDVCPENTVFRDGEAVAFIDLDLAAPTDPLLDVAHLVRMWIPLGTEGSDRPRAMRARMRAALGGYGIEPSEELERAIILAVDQAQAFVRTHPSPAYAELSPEYFVSRSRELIEALNAG
jgi:Ser/Thr protein kinase RdoA (MazF antagonist)